MSRRTANTILFLTVVVGTLLRCLHLERRSFWFDEAFSYTLATQFSWRDMVERTARDVHPPFYYCVLKIWMLLFGDSVVAMRSLSVILAGLTLIGLYLLCHELFKARSTSNFTNDDARGIGIIAAALLCVSSTHIRWSQETRMYTLAAALAVFSTWALWRALSQREKTVRWWALYTVLSAAFLLTHNYALFSVAAHVLFALGFLLAGHAGRVVAMLRTRAFWHCVTSFCLVGWIYLPWLPVILFQKQQVQSGYWIGGIDWWTVPDAWQLLIIPRNSYLVESHMVSLAIVVVLTVVLAVLVRRGGRSEWLLLTMAVVPIVCSVLISLTSVSIVVSRHFLLSYLFIICATSAVVWKYAPSLVRLGVVALLVCDSLFVHVMYQSELKIADRPGVRGAVEYVRASRQSDEPIVVLHPCVYFSVRYYLRDEAHPRLYLPSGLTLHYTGAPILQPSDMIGVAETEAFQSPRLWVIDTNGFSRGAAMIPLPNGWQPQPSKRRSFRDVYFFQREVFVDQFRRVAPQSRQVAKH